MTDADIEEVFRQLVVSQAKCTMVLVELLVVTLHRIGVMEKSDYVQLLRQAIEDPAWCKDKMITAMLSGVIADFEDRNERLHPDWLHGVIEGGAA